MPSHKAGSSAECVRGSLCWMLWGHRLLSVCVGIAGGGVCVGVWGWGVRVCWEERRREPHSLNDYNCPHGAVLLLKAGAPVQSPSVPCRKQGVLEKTCLRAALTNDSWVRVLCSLPEVPSGTEPQVPTVGTSFSKHLFPAALPSLPPFPLPYWHLLGSPPKETTYS